MIRRTKPEFILALALPLLLGAAYACGSSTENGDDGKNGTADGSACTEAADCASGACVNGTCGASGDGDSDGSPGQGGSGAAGPSGQGGDGEPGGSGSGEGGSGTGQGGGATGPGAVGSACTAAADCASGLCASGVCANPSSGPGGTVTTGPHFSGSGNGFRPLTAGCGPDTSSECTGTCEQKGGDPGVKVIRPPATLCFSGAGDPTPDDPGVVIEQSIETLNGVTYVHLRVTFDPHFVDNTYGTGSVGWNPNRPHTFEKDLAKSDHTELLLTDADGTTVINFKIDYVTPDTSQPCGYGTLGVAGGDGSVISGDPSKILALSTSATRNLNGCGYCEVPACEGGDCRVNSPATDEDFTVNPAAPNWDYRAVYEVWIDASAFGGAGFGQAFMTYVHASPSKANTDTINVTPTPCPPSWDKPYCPPGEMTEGGSCFGTPPPGTGGASNTGGTGGSSSGTGGASNTGGTGGGTPRPCAVNYQVYVSTEGASTCTPIPFANYPGMTPCPDGYHIDLLSEGQYCLPNP